MKSETITKYPVNCLDYYEVVLTWDPNLEGHPHFSEVDGNHVLNRDRPSFICVDYYEIGWRRHPEQMGSWTGKGDQSWTQIDPKMIGPNLANRVLEFSTCDLYGKCDPYQVMREMLKIEQFWKYCGTDFSLVRAGSRALIGSEWDQWPPPGYEQHEDMEAAE